MGRPSAESVAGMRAHAGAEEGGQGMSTSPQAVTSPGAVEHGLVRDVERCALPPREVLKESPSRQPPVQATGPLEGCAR